MFHRVRHLRPNQLQVIPNLIVPSATKDKQRLAMSVYGNSACIKITCSARFIIQRKLHPDWNIKI